MLERIPTQEELISIMGMTAFQAWQEINGFIQENYVMDMLWDKGGKEGHFELKYRRGGKTLCTLYPRDNALRVLIIYGRQEREKFETARTDYTAFINDFYDNTHQYHDGKWMFIDLTNSALVEDIKKLLLIKRKPNKKKS